MNVLKMYVLHIIFYFKLRKLTIIAMKISALLNTKNQEKCFFYHQISRCIISFLSMILIDVFENAQYRPVSTDHPYSPVCKYGVCLSDYHYNVVSYWYLIFISYIYGQFLIAFIGIICVIFDIQSKQFCSCVFCTSSAFLTQRFMCFVNNKVLCF